jgi:serine/threonine-protein kinase
VSRSVNAVDGKSNAPVQAGNHGQLGKYRLVATLGQGGMGTVYLAFASGLGEFRKLLVVKELRQDLIVKDTSVAMFIDEARLAARLDHPNVVQTFEADQDNGRYFLAMEYLDGQPLSALVERGGLPLGLHVHLLCEMLAGLQYAHELRDYDGSNLHVVHRDVSPQNVFITYHGQVKVVDFGVAKACNASTLTMPGMFKGKFAYAAPEQATGRPVDARADVFAVGVMLWEAIAGRRFAEPAPTHETFHARATGREPRILEVAPDTEPMLADICNRALAVDPDQRFSSAQAFRSELQDYLLLTGQRPDSAELAQLMREVFSSEREAMHQVIQRAMKQGGATESMVEALPFMRANSVVEYEEEATIVADLSSLAEVSHESDDAKIRASYEVSKITPLRPVSRFSAQPKPPTNRPSKRPLIAAAVSSALTLAGVAGSMWYARGSERQHSMAATAVAAPSAATGALTNTHARGASTPAGAAAASGKAPIAAEPAHATRPTEPTQHVRSRASAPWCGGVGWVVGRAAEPAAAISSTQVLDKPAALEPAPGADLRAPRHTPGVQIDMEDPYQ